MNFLQQPGFTDVLNGKIFLGPLQNRFRGFCRLATLKQQITKKHQHLTDESPKISQSIQFFQPLEETVQLLQLQDIKNCCSSALKTAYFRATQIRKHYFGNFILIIFVIFAITQSQLGKIQQIFFIFLLTYLFAVCYVPFFFAKCFVVDQIERTKITGFI